MDAEHNDRPPPIRTNLFASGQVLSYKFFLPWLLIYAIVIVFSINAPKEIFWPIFKTNILARSTRPPSALDKTLTLYSVPYDGEWHYVKPHRIAEMAQILG
jgi:hypothetical protein